MWGEQSAAKVVIIFDSCMTGRLSWRWRASDWDDSLKKYNSDEQGQLADRGDGHEWSNDRACVSSAISGNKKPFAVRVVKNEIKQSDLLVPKIELYIYNSFNTTLPALTLTLCIMSFI